MRATQPIRLAHDGLRVAKRTRRALREAAVFSINVIGEPGCGKTSFIATTIQRLMPEVHVGVIACDAASYRDAERLSRHTDQLVRVSTGEHGDLCPQHIHRALHQLNLKWMDLLFIESVGSAKCDLGQELTTAIFSVAAGHDWADEHADVVRAANVNILNKIDLLPSVPFDLLLFRRDVKRLNPAAQLFEVSALTGDGFEPWLRFLQKVVGAKS